MSESIKTIRSGREILLDLEQKGTYVFHGSYTPKINLFEPRQAHNYKDDSAVPDGDPAIFASDKADYAILMALIHEKNCPEGYDSSAGTTNDQDGNIILELEITKPTFNQLNSRSKGYVYVFHKKDFTKSAERRVEYKCLNPIHPVEVIQVATEDLPPCTNINKSNT